MENLSVVELKKQCKSLNINLTKSDGSPKLKKDLIKSLSSVNQQSSIVGGKRRSRKSSSRRRHSRKSSKKSSKRRGSRRRSRKVSRRRSRKVSKCHNSSHKKSSRRRQRNLKQVGGAGDMNPLNYLNGLFQFATISNIKQNLDKNLIIDIFRNINKHLNILIKVFYRDDIISDLGPFTIKLKNELAYLLKILENDKMTDGDVQEYLIGAVSKNPIACLSARSFSSILDMFSGPAVPADFVNLATLFINIMNHRLNEFINFNELLLLLDSDPSPSINTIHDLINIKKQEYIEALVKLLIPIVESNRFGSLDIGDESYYNNYNITNEDELLNNQAKSLIYNFNSAYTSNQKSFKLYNRNDFNPVKSNNYYNNLKLKFKFQITNDSVVDKLNEILDSIQIPLIEKSVFFYNLTNLELIETVRY